MSDHDRLLSIAISAVRTAACLVKQVQKEILVDSIDKEDQSPVTIADFASQAVVSRILMETCPEINLVAEENAAFLRQPSNHALLNLVTSYVQTIYPEATSSAICDWIDRGNTAASQNFWTLDPIDGTKGFLRQDQFAVALAYVEDGKVQVGVLGCPNLNEMIEPDHGGNGVLAYAQARKKAWVIPLEGTGGPKQISVSEQDTPQQARLLRSFESGHTNFNTIDLLLEKLGSPKPPVSMDSQAKFLLLAAGQGDIMARLLNPRNLSYREKIWDQAAGSIILTEAGGRITDMAGIPLDFTTGRELQHNVGIVATNTHLHEVVLSLLREIQNCPPS